MVRRKQFEDVGNVNGLIFGVEQNYPAGTQDSVIVSKIRQWWFCLYTRKCFRFVEVGEGLLPGL